MAMSLLSAARASLASMLLSCAHTFLELLWIQLVRVRRPRYLRESRGRLDLADYRIELFTQVVGEVADLVAVRQRFAHRLPRQDQARARSDEARCGRNDQVPQTRSVVFEYRHCVLLVLIW